MMRFYFFFVVLLGVVAALLMGGDMARPRRQSAPIVKLRQVARHRQIGRWTIGLRVELLAVRR